MVNLARAVHDAVEALFPGADDCCGRAAPTPTDLSASSTERTDAGKRRQRLAADDRARCWR